MRDHDYIRFTIYLLSRARQQAQYIAQKELLESLIHDFAHMLASNCGGVNTSLFVDECMREQLGSQYDPYSYISSRAYSTGRAGPEAVSTGQAGPEAGNRSNTAPPPLIAPSEFAAQLQLYAGDGVAERMLRQRGMVTGRLRGNSITFAPIEEPEGEAIGPEEGPTTEQA